MIFTRENYKIILDLIKPRITDFHTPGAGIILRHDIDDLLEKSLQMAQIESEKGIKATYFILDTAPYWKERSEFFDILKMMQSWGHEIGWHNNAITRHLQTRWAIRHCIESPLILLRAHGLTIKLTASHGDRLCHELNYVNYNVFGFKKPGWEGYKGEVFKLSDFDLVQDAIHDPHEGYLSDSGGIWSVDPMNTIKDWLSKNQRNQILIHPQWWNL